MTGKFSNKNELGDRCEHYAGFMRNLNLTTANIIFWILFVFVLLLMCISSVQHHKSNALGEAAKMLPEHETNTRRYAKHVRRLRMRYLGIVGLCLVLSITCTVIEVFAAFNIEYCDGEDLMQLYWGFWSVLQVGSNIAIFGVMLQLWIVLGNVQSPSWAVALGTPVLVFAALTWIFSEITKVVLKKCFHKDIADDEDTSDDESSGDAEGGRGEYNTTMEKWLSRAVSSPTLVDSRRPSTILQAEATRNGLGNGMLPRRNTLPL